MAIAVDSTSTGTNTAGTTVTVAHTCSGSDRVLIVVASAQDGVSTPSATYNGVSMTLVTSINGSQMSSFMFALVAPATGANNIVVTKGSGDEYGVMAVSFTGAGGYSAFSSANNNSGTASDTTNTATGGNGYVVTGGAKNIDTTVTYTGSGTGFANFASASQRYMGAYSSFAGGADVTETWTFTSAKWALTGIEVYELASTSRGGFFLFK